MSDSSETPILLITHAACFAGEAHAKQKRKASDQPYIDHLLRVAASAARADLPAEAIAAAYLHDVVEDTDVTLDELRQEFPERVVVLVNLLTQWWPDDASQTVKASEKPKYYGAILKDKDAINLKLLDRADNLRDMITMLPRARKWAQNYLRRTKEEVEPVLQASHNAYAKRVYREAIAALEQALQKS